MTIDRRQLIAGTALAGAATALPLALRAGTARAATPAAAGTLAQAPGYRRMTVGETVVTALADGYLGIDASAFPTVSQETFAEAIADGLPGRRAAFRRPVKRLRRTSAGDRRSSSCGWRRLLRRSPRTPRQVSPRRYLLRRPWASIRRPRLALPPFSSSPPPPPKTPKNLFFFFFPRNTPRGKKIPPHSQTILVFSGAGLTRGGAAGLPAARNADWVHRRPTRPFGPIPGTRAALPEPFLAPCVDAAPSRRSPPTDVAVRHRASGGWRTEVWPGGSPRSTFRVIRLWVMRVPHCRTGCDDALLVSGRYMSTSAPLQTCPPRAPFIGPSDVAPRMERGSRRARASSTWSPRTSSVDWWLGDAHAVVPWAIGLRSRPPSRGRLTISCARDWSQSTTSDAFPPPLSLGHPALAIRGRGLERKGL